ncbi:hypothetical protein COCNU_07G013580 [Cocos nucifera]|uniref:Uncharacterized protein n=1 Tax=Cocos nucifera TaxID=13894 RepID=A0A8K0IFT3_COCNU|nr:hypothetical protein COCNU_07G013580 [Cocos nucifera]
MMILFHFYKCKRSQFQQRGLMINLQMLVHCWLLLEMDHFLEVEILLMGFGSFWNGSVGGCQELRNENPSPTFAHFNSPRTHDYVHVLKFKIADYSLSSPSNGSLAAHYAKESNTWLTKFNQQRENVDPKAWAHSFEQLHGVNGWALEFEQEQSQMATLEFNFLQFVLKMRHAELIADKNQIKPATGSISADWADEYQAQYHVGPNSWTDKFVHKELSQGMDKWANKFAKEHQQLEVDDQWANEFSKLHVQDWAEEFGHQVNEEFNFLQFVLKMRHAELIADKNQIKPATGSISADWADEYQAQYHVGPNSWTDKFVHKELSQGMDKWANKFAKEHQQLEVDDQWANEFSKLHVQDWAEEFGHQVNEGPFGKSSADDWIDAY